MSENLDTDILLLLKCGSIRAFELLFELYYSKLFRYSYSMTLNRAESEDIVQDVLAKMWENRDSLSIRSNLSGYLFNAVRNGSINSLKRKKRNTSINDSSILLEITEKTNEDIKSLEEIAIRENRQQFEECVRKLPEQCRKIFECRRNEGLSVQEIAQKFDISVNTVYVQIYRAVHKLSEELKNELVK